METFFHRHLISQTTGDRFDIHGILRDCLKEYFKIKDIKGKYVVVGLTNKQLFKDLHIN